MNNIVQITLNYSCVACRTGVIFLSFAGKREGQREARGERGARRD